MKKILVSAISSIVLYTSNANALNHLSCKVEEGTLPLIGSEITTELDENNIPKMFIKILAHSNEKYELSHIQDDHYEHLASNGFISVYLVRSADSKIETAYIAFGSDDAEARCIDFGSFDGF